VYKLAVLNHSLLSSLASLGTYIQSHKTTTASEAFNVVVDTAIKKLDNHFLLNENNAKLQENILMEDLEIRFTELKNIREKELKQGMQLMKRRFN
jgi:hypothetical protein